MPSRADEALKMLDEYGKFGEMYKEFQQAPEKMIVRFGEIPDFAIAVARADVEVFLRGWFEPTKGWQPASMFPRSTDRSSVAVEWQWDGEHTSDTFAGLVPTGHAVEVRGMSVLTAEHGRFQIKRYVDWAGLYAQLGLVLSWRTPTGAGPI